MDYIISFEDFEKIDEGWKQSALTVAIAAATLFGGVKKASSQQVVRSEIVKNNKSDSIRIDFSSNFSSGKYSFSKNDIEDLTKKLTEISDFINKNPGSDFKININSSESKVTNYDAEESSPTYKKALPVGEIAKKRSELMELTIKTFIDKLREKIKFGKVTLTKNPSVGGPEWVKGGDQNDPKYTAYQYVKVDIFLMPNSSTTTTYKTDTLPYKRVGGQDQIVYDENHRALAMINWVSSNTNDVKSNGNLDTRYSDVLFQVVNDWGYTGVNYLIPYQWWNKNVSNNKITKQNMKDIENGVDSNGVKCSVKTKGPRKGDKITKR